MFGMHLKSKEPLFVAFSIFVEMIISRGFVVILQWKTV